MGHLYQVGYEERGYDMVVGLHQGWGVSLHMTCLCPKASSALENQTVASRQCAPVQLQNVILDS